jgi:hypothetical protein
MTVINGYLRSGIPVVLTIYGSDFGHAVVAVGYKEDGTLLTPRNISGTRVVIRNLGYEQVYVHDDRLGPYARATLVPGPGIGLMETPLPVPGLRPPTAPLQIQLTAPGGGTTNLAVGAALVPLYPKVRTSIDQIMNYSFGLLPYMAALTSTSGKALGLELSFERCGTYQGYLYDTGLEPTALIEFQKKIALSRYVAVSRWYLDDAPLVDYVWDTTDNVRSETLYDESLLALVVYNDAYRANIDDLATNHLVPRTQPLPIL